MDIYDTRYFRVNKLLLSCLGLWPIQSPLQKNTFYYCAILGILIILLPQIAFLFNCVRGLDDVYDVLPLFIGAWLCLLKLTGLHWHTEKFRVLIEHVRYDWYLLAKHRDMRILIEYVEASRIFTLGYLIFTSTSTTCMVTTPFTMPLLDIILASNVTRPKQMPHPTEFFFDVEKYFYILLAITFVGYAVCATIVIAIDSIYFALLQHACGTLAILSGRLKKLAVNDNSKFMDHNSVSKEESDVKNLVQCIQLQIRVERLIHLIESTFAICLFTDIGVGILLQCSACVMIVTHTELVRNGPLLVLQCTRFFCNSWIGQRIIDHSSQISVAAYNGLWYQTSLKTKKMLLFLLMKCQTPYRITMGKLYVICLESYTMLMKTSASYVTLMVSLNSDDDM
ncbi:PREDICTED: uncharacterized protein LOC105567911 [Vollenhovia emeryi]|uniref:uncharacterized protein LOC105567911 n=1 Tax=Vollenhovia emeryi TaxID=411798 RepID=UPI0005F4E5BF|nr:PREDICTED: uncharacterized protein LOC105567911 [Vollenhovia emeryi]